MAADFLQWAGDLISRFALGWWLLSLYLGFASMSPSASDLFNHHLTTKGPKFFPCRADHVFFRKSLRGSTFAVGPEGTPLFKSPFLLRPSKILSNSLFTLPSRPCASAWRSATAFQAARCRR